MWGGKRGARLGFLLSRKTEMNSLIQHHGQLRAQPPETAAKPFVRTRDWDIINTHQIAFSGGASLPGPALSMCVRVRVKYLLLTVTCKRPVGPFGNPFSTPNNSLVLFKA